jgi:phosphoserine aminotransferase
MSVMEMSHRGKDYETIHYETIQSLRAILGVPEGWGVLFLQGGASLQNAMVPMNLGIEGRTPNYIDTGTWGHKSIGDAKKLGPVHIAWTSEPTNFDHAPEDDEPSFSDDVSYIYFTSNETIQGVDYLRDPQFKPDVPIVCDMSSNILSRPLDLNRYDVIFAGAQKNQGPAGVATVLLSPRAIEIANTKNLPLMLSWTEALKADSIHNTPPCWAIYICGLYYKWVIKEGGLQEMARRAEKRASLIYDVIDQSEGFYIGHAHKKNRSKMNISFRTNSEELDKKFIEEAEANGMKTIAGHRSVGGMRASMYNAFPVSGAEMLAEFMQDFAKRNG